jgi:hypothetical protein
LKLKVCGTVFVQTPPAWGANSKTTPQPYALAPHQPFTSQRLIFVGVLAEAADWVMLRGFSQAQPGRQRHFG